MTAEAYRFYNKIKHFVRQNAMLVPGDGVVAGVSGGADSVCLLRILHALGPEYGLRLVVVHVHHGIRGADADADEAFVRDECARLGILFEAVRADVPALAAQWGCPLEEAGRRVRYEAFRKAAALHGCGKIAVAHNENDNAETFLFQAFRGSGIWGLAGIAPCRAEGEFVLIRPLLCVGRPRIEAYLAAEGAAYRTDASNGSMDYTRNRIRGELLPLAQSSVNAGAVAHLAEAAAGLREAADFLRGLVADAYRRVAREGASEPPGEVLLDAAAWQALPPYLQKEVIRYALGHAAGGGRDLGRVHVQAVCGLMCGAVGKRVSLPRGLAAIRTYDAVRIVPAGGETCGENRKSCSDGGEIRGESRETCADSGEIRMESRESCGDGGEIRVESRENCGGGKIRGENRKNCGGGKIRRESWETCAATAGRRKDPIPQDPDIPRLAQEGCVTITSFPARFDLGKYELTLHLADIHGDYGDYEKKSINPKNRYTKCFDYGKIRNTLVLRTRQAGDYVVINADGSKKSLKSLLIDKKVPAGCRGRLPLLAAGSSVLWAVGVRGGEGFYVTQNTKQVLVAELRRKDRNCDGREG